MKHLLFATFLLAFTSFTHAQTLPFTLKINGEGTQISQSLELSDLGEGKTDLSFSFTHQKTDMVFHLKYKPLPQNRSFPGNLDITLKDSKGKKLGYLFFAINDVAFLKQMGSFGLMVDFRGKPLDMNLVFDTNQKGSIDIDDLQNERFVQDTLIPKLGFQMIRPVVLPKVNSELRSVSYSLDSHPYAINYTLKNIDNGLVQFQHNLYATKGKQQLLERIYFNANSLETLREAMYAGKYFDKTHGTFKLVFYPAMGQTTP